MLLGIIQPFKYFIYQIYIHTKILFCIDLLYYFCGISGTYLFKEGGGGSRRVGEGQGGMRRVKEGRGGSRRVGEGQLLTAAWQLSGGYCVLDGSDIPDDDRCISTLGQ